LLLFGPFLRVLQDDEHVGALDGHGIGGHFGGSDLAHHLVYLWKVAQEDLFQLCSHSDGVAEVAALPNDIVRGEVTFVEFWNELATEAIEHEQR